MKRIKFLTGLATIGLAAAIAGSAGAQERGGGPMPGASVGAPPAGGRSAAPVAPAALDRGMRAPSGPIRMEAPGRPQAGPAARIEPRIRSGVTDFQQRTFRPDRTLGGAPVAAQPLTIRRGERYREQRYGDRRDRFWFPSVMAAPFLFPWYTGGGYDDDWFYADDLIDDPYYGTGYTIRAYPGPASTFGPAYGNYCATPQKTCLLYQPAEVGLGCSCRAPAGRPRFRGEVVP